MLKELKEKYDHVIKSSSHMWANGNFSFYRLGIFITSYKGQKRIWNFLWKVVRYIFRKIFGIKPDRTPDYDLWMKQWFPDRTALQQYRTLSKDFTYRPKVSILLPVYNPPAAFFRQAIESVISQVYDNWELCIADDHSTDPEIRDIILQYENSDSRIRSVFRDSNGHISECSNSALAIATGEFIALLDHDDLLSADALYQVVNHLVNHPGCDLVYSDEDKVDENGKHTDPHFKPDWCPDNFLSRNYIGHLVVIRKTLVDKVGGFRKGFEGSQDYDLLLRVTELTDSIHHLPLVLYHWRMHEASTSVNEGAKLYAFDSGVRALEEALSRRNIKGSVSLIENLPGFYSIRYDVLKPGKVSVIIPTKNKHDLCEVAVGSVFQLTSWPDFEVILIDNNSDDPAFFSWVKTWPRPMRGSSPVSTASRNCAARVTTSATPSPATWPTTSAP